MASLTWKMSGHFIPRNRLHGFTLLELLTVLLLIGLITAVALPRTTQTLKESLPIMLKNLFQEASLSSLASGKGEKIDFQKDKIVLGKDTLPYPAGISPDGEFVIEFTEAGFARPTELVFRRKKGKMRFKVGLLGIYPEDGNQ